MSEYWHDKIDIANCNDPKDYTNPLGTVFLNPHLTKDGEMRLRGRLDNPAFKTMGIGGSYKIEPDRNIWIEDPYKHNDGTDRVYGAFYDPMWNIIPGMYRRPAPAYNTNVTEFIPFIDKKNRFRAFGIDPYGRGLVATPYATGDGKLKAYVGGARAYEWMNYYNMKYTFSWDFFAWNLGWQNYESHIDGDWAKLSGGSPITYWSWDTIGNSDWDTMYSTNYPIPELMYLTPYYGFYITESKMALPADGKITLSNENIIKAKDIPPNSFWSPSWRIKLNTCKYSIKRVTHHRSWEEWKSGIPFQTEYEEGEATWYIVISTGYWNPEGVWGWYNVYPWGIDNYYSPMDGIMGHGIYLIDEQKKKVVSNYTMSFPLFGYYGYWGWYWSYGWWGGNMILHNQQYMDKSIAFMGEVRSSANWTHYHWMNLYDNTRHLGAWGPEYPKARRPMTDQDIDGPYFGFVPNIHTKGLNLSVEPWKGECLF